MKLEALEYSVTGVRQLGSLNKVSLEITATDSKHTYVFSIMLWTSPPVSISQEIINAITVNNTARANYLSRLFSAIYILNKQEIHERVNEAPKLPI
jgi:hypothetical protein